MKRESMIGRRLYALLIDVTILFIAVFLFDYFASTPIINATTQADEVFTSYNTNVNRYNEIAVEYGVATKDDNGKVHFISAPDPEKQNNFMSNEEIIDLRVVIPDQQNQLIGFFALRVSFSIFVCSFIAFYIVPLCVGKGRTVGKLIAKLAIVDKDYSYITWYKLLLRYFISTITNVYLFLLTLGLVPLLHLIFTINQKENQTLYDLACKVYVIDGKIPSLILKESLKQSEEEMENEQNETH